MLHISVFFGHTSHLSWERKKGRGVGLGLNNWIKGMRLRPTENVLFPLGENSSSNIVSSHFHYGKVGFWIFALHSLIGLMREREMRQREREREGCEMCILDGSAACFVNFWGWMESLVFRLESVLWRGFLLLHFFST